MHKVWTIEIGLKASQRAHFRLKIRSVDMLKFFAIFLAMVMKSSLSLSWSFSAYHFYPAIPESKENSIDLGSIILWHRAWTRLSVQNMVGGRLL
jgi:hypothetical protein